MAQKVEKIHCAVKLNQSYKYVDIAISAKPSRKKKVKS